MTVRTLTPKEVEREARRILPRLTKDDSYLAPLVTSASAGLFTKRNNFAKPVIEFGRVLLDAFASRGWIEGKDSRWTLSEAGLAWLRREAGGSDPFRAQHQLRAHVSAEVGSVKRSVLVNEGECALGWLRRRKDKSGTPLISEAQFNAGERLRADFWRAHLSPRVTSDWSSAAPSRRSRRAAPSGVAALRDDAVAARQRVQSALEMVGPELAGILLDVCCHLQGLEEAERGQGWPHRAGKVILQLALTRLARHYGLVSEGDANAPIRRRLQHWGVEGYRPSLDTWR